jgi:hypothetical protein
MSENVVETQQEQTTDVNENVVEAPTADAPTSEEDIFNSIFGDNTQEFAALQDSQGDVDADKPLEQEQSVDPKEDDTQFQYWQSQTDKKQAEIDELKGQVSDLIQAVKSPASAQANTVGAEKETETLQRPVKPKKPVNFDHSEALTDPDSDSAKYLAAKDGYVEELSDYMLAVEEQRNVELEQAKAIQRKSAQEQELMTDLQANYNYSPAEAKDFLKKMTAPESLTLDNLVKLHRMDLNEGQQTIAQIDTQSMEKQATMSSRQQKLSIPKPVSVQPGVNVQSSRKTAENTMMDSMLTDYKKRNPFG